MKMLSKNMLLKVNEMKAMTKNNKVFFIRNRRTRRRSIYHACGYSTQDLNRPHIGIVNAFNEATPGHIHLRSLAEAVKSGVWQAGGAPNNSC